MSAPGDLSEGMMIGNDAELNDWGMDGKLDELRFSPERSDEWVRFYTKTRNQMLTFYIRKFTGLRILEMLLTFGKRTP